MTNIMLARCPPRSMIFVPAPKPDAVTHPSHAAVVNEVFGPSAHEAAGDAAATHPGRMADHATPDRAKEMLGPATRLDLVVPTVSVAEG